MLLAFINAVPDTFEKTSLKRSTKHGSGEELVLSLVNSFPLRARVRALWGLSGWRGNERIAEFTAMLSKSSARSALLPASALAASMVPDEGAIGAKVAAANPECQPVFFLIELQRIGGCLASQALRVG